MDKTGLSRGHRLLALIVLAAAIPASAGIHRTLPTGIFTFEQHPDLPLRDYAAGRLGILQPTYARSYLYVAYRWMSGAPMTAEEVEQIDRYWQVQLAGSNGPKAASAAEAYDKARGALPIPWQAPEKPNSYAAAQYLAVDYVYYSKCSDDAFATAAETLQARIGAFGRESREVAEWVRGQDYVFENCFGSGSGFVPPAVAGSVDPLIRADRDYQVAAALFYSSRYTEAASAFRRVAADTRSPWAPLGRYLAGRSLLWQARTNPAGSAAYLAALRQAESELKLAAGDGPAEARDAARWLLGRVLMRTNPSEAAGLLSGSLLSPLRASARESELRLMTQLMDNLANDPAALAQARGADDMVDWIFNFQDESPEAFDYAVERWRAGGSVTWLVAAMAKAAPGEPAAVELVKAAGEIEGHPASATIDFLAARLIAEAGDRDLARAIADSLIERLQGLPSSRNRVLSMRATLAESDDELMFFGARPPAFVSYAYGPDGRYYPPWKISDDQARSLERYMSVVMWGPETAEILNESVNVDVLAGMIDIEGQSDSLRTELLLAAWTRALLLDRWDLVRKMAPKVGEAAPSMAADLERLLGVTDQERMRYFAASGLLKTPGASILLRSGPIRVAGRPEHVSEDGLNWWPAEWAGSGLADYLPESDRLVVNAEWAAIRAKGGGYLWLAEQVLAEAQRPDAHPSVAEALYRVATCLDGVDLRWGHPGTPPDAANAVRARAVEMLQARFSGSEWTPRAMQALNAGSWN